MSDSAFCLLSWSQNGVIQSFSRYDVSIVEFKMIVLEESITVFSPNRRIFVTTASLNSTILTLLILFRRVIIFSR